MGNWFFERWLRRVAARAAGAAGPRGRGASCWSANTVFEHDGKAYHLQVEDLGLEAAAFEIRVYDDGTVLWRKKVPYQDLLDKKLPRPELEEQLRGQMERALLTMEAAIAKGKLG